VNISEGRLRAADMGVVVFGTWSPIALGWFGKAGPVERCNVIRDKITV
jgi:hypothetical protein